MRLQELDRLKDDFVSTITHELRTPLTSIRAFAEILLDNPDLDGQQRESYLRVVVEETERLTRLINAVLDLAKLESGGSQWRLETVDVRQLLETSAQATAQLFRDRQVALELELGEAVPAVEADRGPGRAGRGQPAVERREVLRSRHGTGAAGSAGRRRRRAGRRAGQRTGHRRRGPGHHLREVSSGRRHRLGSSRRAPVWGCRSAGRSSTTSAAGCGWTASRVEGATFSFTLPVADERSAAAMGAETES